MSQPSAERSDHVVRGHGRDQWMGWNTHIYRCPWCRRKRGLTHLELYGVAGFSKELRGYRIVYPHDDYVIAIVSHPGCGPDVGYAVPLDALAADPNHWYKHISSKTWAPPYLKDIIYDVLLLHRKAAYHLFHPDRGKKYV